MPGWLIRRVRSSLSARLALLTGILLALAVTMVGGLIFTAGRLSLQQHIQSSLSGLAAARAGEIAGVVEQDYERTALIASRTRLREHLIELGAGNGDADTHRSDMVRILDDAIASVEAVHLVEILDPSGAVVVRAGEQAGPSSPPDVSLVVAGLRGFVHGSWYALDGEMHYDVYGPLLHPRTPGGDAIGCVRTAFGVSRVLDILTDYTGLGETGELELGMREGDRIRLLNPSRDAGANMAARYLSSDAREGEAMRRAAAGQTGFLRDSVDCRGVRTLAAYMPVPAGDYYLVAKIDRAEAFAPVWRLALWGAAGGGVIILLGLICAVAFARLLVRPVRALVHATQAIADGDFAHRVPVFGSDETGRLAESFNHMVARIREITASRDELDREVQERKKAEACLAATAETLQDQNTLMIEDLNMARDIQAALLPRKQIAFRSSTIEGRNTLNFAHFYRPSRALGGDFFQVIPLSDHSAAALVCDVMGHGVRSALVTAIFRGLMEEQRQGLDDPSKVLCRLNRGLMTVLSQPEQFTLVSAACLVFDLVKRRVACANAGHPVPFVIDRMSGAVRPLGPDVEHVGPALGADPNPFYDVIYHPLEKDVRYLLYTDGMFEVAAPGRDTFMGERRFREIVAAHAADHLEGFIDGIVRDIEVVRGGADFDDDLCMLGVELGSL